MVWSPPLHTGALLRWRAGGGLNIEANAWSAICLDDYLIAPAP